MVQHHNCGKQGEFNDIPEWDEIEKTWYIRSDDDDYYAVSNIKYCPFCGIELPIDKVVL